VAVQTLLKLIESPKDDYPEGITFEPELMVRESTGAAPTEPLQKGPRGRRNNRTLRLPA